MAYPSNLPDDPSELEGMEETKAPATLANITVFADRYIELDLELKNLDEYSKKLEEEQREIEEVQLPQIMAQLAMENFGMKDGFKLAVEPKFQGSVVVKDAAMAAKQLAWIESAKGADIIKTEVSLSFPKGREKEAEILIKTLDQLGFVYKVKRGVHASTLASFVKEKMKISEDVPLDDLNWRYFNKATIKKKGFKMRKRRSRAEAFGDDEGGED